MHKPLRITVVSLLAMTTLARASTILHTVDPSLYQAEALLYPSVGKVTGQVNSGSGVMLSDRWVLTAAHISQGKKAGDIFNVGGIDYHIESTITHSGYQSAGANSYDIGLLYLSEPAVGVSAASMYRFDQPGSIIGREATYVGFGFTGTGLTGAQSSPIELRAFTNLIEFYGSQYGLTTTSIVSDFDNPTGTSNRQDSNPNPTRLEGALAPGDSGGGVFVTVDGVRYLVGINSYSGYVNLSESNSKYGGISGATDLQQFYPWIQANTGIAPVPEAGTLWFCALGCLLGFVRRR